MRTLSYLLKAQKKNIDANETKKQEKEFRKDFWKFSKNAAHGTLGTKPVSPTFDKTIADQYYPGKYSSPVIIDPVHLFWFPKVESLQ